MSIEISADLYYFLRIARLRGIKIYLFNEEIVIMGAGGFSNISTLKRLIEVFYSYQKSYSFFAIIPFSLRYFKRLLSLIIS